MAELRGFLGKDFELPEDRLYDGSRQYWVKSEAGGEGTLAVVGVSEPGVALTVALLDLDVFPEPGDELAVDEEIAFATTKKNMKYFLSPLAGRVLEANPAATAEAVNTAPYETWLVKLKPEAGWENRLLDAQAYATEALRDRARHPGGGPGGPGGQELAHLQVGLRRHQGELRAPARTAHPGLHRFQRRSHGG